MARNFMELLHARWSSQCFICVGLDPDPSKFPPLAGRPAVDERPDLATAEFCDQIVEATADHAAAYKLNLAFFLALGEYGAATLIHVVAWIKSIRPNVPIILDGKFNDIGNSAEQYARFAFDVVGADAVTVNPYLGSDSLQPFLTRVEKGVFILCRTSNPGSVDFQTHEVDHDLALYRQVASLAHARWNHYGNCGLVVGATYPAELAFVRQSVDNLPILIPGIGAQGGDLRAAVRAGKDRRGQGFLINVSRDIIYADRSMRFAEVASERLLAYTRTTIEALGER